MGVVDGISSCEVDEIAQSSFWRGDEVFVLIIINTQWITQDAIMYLVIAIGHISYDFFKTIVADERDRLVI